MSFVVVSILIVSLTFLILLYSNKNSKPKKKAQEVAVDAVTFTSGIILFLYILGMAIEIPYLKEIDDFSLLIAFFVGGISLISSVTDKYKSKKKNNKNKDDLKNKDGKK